MLALIIKIVKEHTLYKRFLQDISIALFFDSENITAKYPFPESFGIIKKIKELKSKADKYDDIINNKSISIENCDNNKNT